MPNETTDPDVERRAARSRLIGIACGRCRVVVRARFEPSACFRCGARFTTADPRNAAPRALLRLESGANEPGTMAIAIEFRGAWTDVDVAALEARVRVMTDDEAVR